MPVSTKDLFWAMHACYFRAGWPVTYLMRQGTITTGLTLYTALVSLYQDQFSYRSVEARNELAMWHSLFYALVQEGHEAEQAEGGTHQGMFVGRLFSYYEGAPPAWRVEATPPSDATDYRPSWSHQLAYCAATVLRQFAFNLSHASALIGAVFVDGRSRLDAQPAARQTRTRTWLRAFCTSLSWVPLSLELNEQPMRAVADCLGHAEVVYRLPRDLLTRRPSEAVEAWSQEHTCLPVVEDELQGPLKGLSLIKKLACYHGYDAAYCMEVPAEEELPGFL